MGNSTYERAPQGPGNDFSRSRSGSWRIHISPCYYNVTAIADTGAQVNVWSLDEFVKYGFPHDILTPASNLVVANHSSISIVGAFFAIIEGLSCHGYVVQCRAMVYVSADIQTLFLSHGTLSTLGVLSPSFPLLGEHANAETQVNLLPSLMRTSRALSLVAAPHRAIKIILALALNVLPCHHPTVATISLYFRK